MPVDRDGSQRTDRADAGKRGAVQARRQAGHAVQTQVPEPSLHSTDPDRSNEAADEKA